MNDRIEKLREAVTVIRNECKKRRHLCHVCPLFYVICYRDISPSAWLPNKIEGDNNE